MIGMLKQSQVRTNRAAFSEALMSRHPANCVGWLATMPTGRPSTRPKPDDDVHRISGLDLEELVVVEDAGDHLVHVVRLVRRVRDQRVELEVLVGEVVLDGALRRRHRVARRVGVVVGRQIAQQIPDVVERVLFTGGDVVRGAGLGHVRVRAAQLLHRDVLTGDGLDHVRPGDEHLAGLVDHHDEVGQRGGVDMPARGRAHDQRDLRDDARGEDVAVEDLAVQAQRDHALLDARARTVVDADQRAAGLDREILNLDDLLAVDLAEAAAEHGDVLAEDAHVAAVDGAVTGHHAVAERAFLLQAEVGAAVPGQRVQLDERTLVQQRVDALARGQLALGVHLLDRRLTDRVLGLLFAPAQIGELARGGVDVDGVLGGGFRSVLGVLGAARHDRKCYRQTPPRTVPGPV